MGIDGFQPWIRERFGEAKRGKRLVAPQMAVVIMNTKADGQSVRRLFIDLNALVHEVINIVYLSASEKKRQRMREDPKRYWFPKTGEQDFRIMPEDGSPNLENRSVFGLLVDMIDYITTQLVQPTHLLYLGMDGVVVKAKMMQQRQRTAASLLMSDGLFDRTHVKPGTEFMTSLSVSVKEALKARKKAQPSAWPKTIEFSDQTIAGEGEHKIMARMRRPLAREPRNWNKMMDVVYSPDADMGILTMLHGQRNNTTLVMRSQDSWNRKLVEHVMSGKKGNTKNDTLGDRWEFFNYSAIRDEIQHQYKLENIQDLVVISCLAGNDFLPKLPCCRLANKIMVFDAILDCYRYTFPVEKPSGNLVDNNLNVQWSNVESYLHNFVTEYAHILLTEMNKQQEKSTHPYRQYTRGDESRKWQVLTDAAMIKSETKVQDWMSKEVKERLRSVNPMVFAQYYRRHVSGYFGNLTDNLLNVNFDLTNDMVHNWLEGLTYVVNYYQYQADGVNFNWNYNFHYAPASADILEYLKTHPRVTWGSVPLHDIKYVATPMEHLCAILPKHKLYLLPDVVRMTIEDHMPELFYDKVYFDDNYVPFSDDRGHEIHNGVILIDFPSLGRINKALHNIREHPTVKDRNRQNNLFRVGYKVEFLDE